MKITTKYNIGDRIGFERNEKEIIAKIIEIQVNVKPNGNIIKYYLDYNVVVPAEYGELTELPMIVDESEIKGRVDVKYRNDLDLINIPRLSNDDDLII